MELFYEERGKGIPLLLLHGFPFDHSIWDEVSNLFDDQYRLITPDLRGHGRSKAISGEFSIRDMAYDVMQLLDQLDIESVAVAGHSMGGYIALDLFRKFPDRISEIALISSQIFEDSMEKKRLRMESIDKIKDFRLVEALSNMPNLLTKDPEIQERCRWFIKKMDTVGAAGAQYAMTFRSSSETLWRDMPIRQLVIAGQDDQIIPIEMSREISTFSKLCTFVEIENVGHMPMLEAPETVADCLRNFIN